MGDHCAHNDNDLRKLWSIMELQNEIKSSLIQIAYIEQINNSIYFSNQPNSLTKQQFQK